MWPSSCELSRPYHTPSPTLPVWYSKDIPCAERQYSSSRMKHRRGDNSRQHRQPREIANATTSGDTMSADHLRDYSAMQHHTPRISVSTPRTRKLDDDLESIGSCTSSAYDRRRYHHRRRRRPSTAPESLYMDVPWSPTRMWMDTQRHPAGGGSLTQDYRMSRAPLTYSCSDPSLNWGHTLNGGFGRSDGFTNNVFFQTGRQSHGPDLRSIARTSPNRVTRVC